MVIPATPLSTDSRPPFLMPAMSAGAKTNPADVRINNRMAIFSLLFPYNTFSRAQLSRQTGLSGVAASGIVSELIDHHFLQESGKQSASDTTARRGKKGTLVSIDDNHWNIISIDLSEPYLIKGAVTNLLGQTAARAEHPVSSPKDINPEDVEALCEELLESCGRHALGIGVAAPGIVDCAGTIISAPNFGWNDLKLGSILHERFHLPAFIDNDANAAMLAERFYGQGTSNTLFLQIVNGIGASLLIDDLTVLGTHHAAGEIGHVVVKEGGPACVCGKHGCLEAMYSVDALRARITSGEDRATVLAEAGRGLGHALAMPCCMLDIDDVAVYGPPDVINDLLIEPMKDTLNEISSFPWRPPITVRRSQGGNDIVLRGESIAVLQTMLQRL